MVNIYLLFLLEDELLLLIHYVGLQFVQRRGSLLYAPHSLLCFVQNSSTCLGAAGFNKRGKVILMPLRIDDIITFHYYSISLQ